MIAQSEKLERASRLRENHNKQKSTLCHRKNLEKMRRTERILAQRRQLASIQSLHSEKLHQASTEDVKLRKAYTRWGKQKKALLIDEIECLKDHLKRAEVIANREMMALQNLFIDRIEKIRTACPRNQEHEAVMLELYTLGTKSILDKFTNSVHSIIKSERDGLKEYVDSDGLRCAINYTDWADSLRN